MKEVIELKLIKTAMSCLLCNEEIKTNGYAKKMLLHIKCFNGLGLTALQISCLQKKRYDLLKGIILFEDEV